jgi:hypothetical protein
MGWATAGQIIDDAVSELGLGSLPDPYSVITTDAVAAQLVKLLKSCGRDLAGMRWSHLLREHTLVTVAGTLEYDLPPDFNGVEDDTEWATGMGPLRLGGPLDSTEWTYLRAGGISPVLVSFRIAQGKLKFAQDPGDQTIVYEYRTTYWVAPPSSTLPTQVNRAAPEVSADVVMLDDLLLMRYLKLAWLRGKNMDTTAAQQDYDTTLESALNVDRPSPALSMTPGRGNAVLIGVNNLPPTGFGQ